jgi:2,3-bisphosphoglycerate-independent phosphoglycerate mutase
MKLCRPLVLIILDGWGHTQDVEYNAIIQANTPIWDSIWHEYPHTFLHASEMEVGLPDGQMGNSEVGHLNLGAGRVVYQDFTLIGKEIDNGQFFANHALNNAVNLARDSNKALHIFGLLSPGGVHSHEDHIEAMIKLAVERGAEQIYLHAFLDGRDTPPSSARDSIDRFSKLFNKLGKGRFASLIGRYYVMDRDNRWDRVSTAYHAMAEGDAEFSASNAAKGLEMAYARNETDEFVKPTLIIPEGEQAVRIEDGDVIVFMNFRADRAREITKAFYKEDFNGFERPRRIELGSYVCLTQYHKDFGLPVAYPPTQPANVFGEWVSKHGLHQLRIAETEKYAHVTFFFNGGQETVYPGEDRILVSSPKVATYDLQPEMSAKEVTEKLVESIRCHDDPFDVIICNFANSDMVGHTGDFEAAKKAVETVDWALGQITDAALNIGGEVLITADHGNIEKMRDPITGQAHTAHTTNLVPFIYVGPRKVKMSLQVGALADVSPTMLHLLGLPQPEEMTGHSLIKVQETETMVEAIA